MMRGIAKHQIAVMGAIGRGLRTLEQLVEHLPIPRNYVVRPLSRLVTKGHVERDEDGGYKLTSEGLSFIASGETIRYGRTGPRSKVRTVKGDYFRQRAWNAMRLQPRFMLTDILLLAQTPGDHDPTTNLRSYVHQLAASGFVLVLPDRVPSSGLTRTPHKVFRLVRDSGEKAPKYRRERRVMHDPNTGEDFPCR